MNYIQRAWLVALRPFSSPAAPNSSEPVQTLPTRFARAPRSARKRIVAGSSSASSVPFNPPGTSRRSRSAGQSAKVWCGLTQKPPSPAPSRQSKLRFKCFKLLKPLGPVKKL